jgi:hypothetical protein
MKQLLGITIALVGMAASAEFSQAQIITWSDVTTAPTDSSVLTNGSYVDAATFNSGGATVNGVDFNAISGSSDGSDISITNAGSVNYNAYSTASGSTNISDAISNIGYVVGAPGTVTLSGLTANDMYQVQVFNYDLANTDASVATSLSGSPAADFTNANAGGFAIGTFTADSAGDAVSFNYSLDPGATYSIINAVSVREVPVVAPEPSTVWLLGLGLGCLMLYVRRQRAA